MTFLTHICSHFANDKFNNSTTQFISKNSLNLAFLIHIYQEAYTYFIKRLLLQSSIACKQLSSSFLQLEAQRQKSPTGCISKNIKSSWEQAIFSVKIILD